MSYTGYNSGYNIANKIALENNGKYVFVGTSGNSTTNTFFSVARINTDLTSDDGFGTLGFTNTSFGNATNECYNLAIQPDNKIVAVGLTGNDFAIARYLGYDTPVLNNIQLLIPTDLSSNQNYSNLAFDWSDAFGAVSYQIEIDTSQTFSSSEMYTTLTSDFVAIGLLPNTQYFWKVKASDGSSWGDYSDIRSFTTNALENFHLENPSNNSTNQEYTSLILNWSDNIGASSYELQIDTTQNFTTNPQVCSSLNSTYTITLLPSKTYFWKVRATNGINFGEWTNVWRFKTKGELSSSIHEEHLAGIKIYPNPSNELITILVSEFLKNSSFKLLDSKGKELYSGFIEGEQITFDFIGFSKGIYFLQIGENSQKTFKLIKE